MRVLQIMVAFEEEIVAGGVFAVPIDPQNAEELRRTIIVGIVQLAQAIEQKPEAFLPDFTRALEAVKTATPRRETN